MPKAATRLVPSHNGTRFPISWLLPPSWLRSLSICGDWRLIRSRLWPRSESAWPPGKPKGWQIQGGWDGFVPPRRQSVAACRTRVELSSSLPQSPLAIHCIPIGAVLSSSPIIRSRCDKDPVIWRAIRHNTWRPTRHTSHVRGNVTHSPGLSRRPPRVVSWQQHKMYRVKPSR
jgi:hypothetical protein